MAALALALPIFAITLFVSAFLLFLVQPMIGKMVLPNLGGTPQVWNTCMMFFQTVLLCGYAYTHFLSTRLKLRTQLMVHGVLLLVPLVLLFIASFRDKIFVWFGNYPPEGGNPIWMTLVLLLIVVGLPFFVVSTSAPLLQKWFTYTGHPAAKDPYFLYGASNLGSMLSLVFFPLVFERTFGLGLQSWIWTGGYICLVILFFVCVSMVWNAPPLVHLPASEAPAEEKVVAEAARKPEAVTAITAGKPGQSLSTRIKKGGKQIGKGKPMPGAPATTRDIVRQPYVEVRSDVITPWRRLRWILLAAVPSSLMLGIITYISTDVSPIAMFWVIPLALYLLSFILVFARWPVVWTRQPHTLMVIGYPIVFIFFLLLIITPRGFTPWQQIPAAILAFFLTAMVCHGELARDRPSPKHLTEFYLMMSIGGMLGGVFNGLFAPILFWGLAELPIALALSSFMRPYTYRLAPVEKPLLIGYCAVLGLLVGWPLLGGWLGVFAGLILGAIVGAVMNFDAIGSHGWIDNGLVKMFPGLGEWFDEKGKELAAESSPPPEPVEAEEPKKKVIVKSKAPPDYYVLHYALDVALPVVVLILMMVFTQNIDPIYNSLTKVFSSLMDRNTAGTLAYQIATVILPYGVPIMCALMFAYRPLRFGLAISAVLLVNSMNTYSAEGREILHRDRSYFGILKVMRDPGKYLFDIMDPIDVLPSQQVDHNYDRLFDKRKEELKYVKDRVASSKSPTGFEYKDVKPGTDAPYHYLMHGTTHHGLNYQTPWGLRRLATTYYHRKGPVGMVMERMNWFSASARPGDSSLKWEKYAPQNTYWADARMPATIISSFTMMNGLNPFPADQLVGLWTEPPYACVGLGTGTMASYARPFQHMTFYEIDAKIRSFSLGDWELPDGETGPYFNYVHDAIERGAGVEIVMGDARLSMRKDVEDIRQQRIDNGQATADEKWRENLSYQHREGYYFAIELDAFSSDAIPVHLITEEAFEQYFEKLAPQGVLLVHTSNRHVDLVKPVTDICHAKGYVYRVCNDHGEKTDNVNPQVRKTGTRYTICTGERGHFQSEYVIVARKVEDLPNPIHEVTSPEDVKTYYSASYLSDPADFKGPYAIWQTPAPPHSRIWTDDFSDFISVFRWGWGH